MSDDFYDRPKDRETVISTDHAPIKIYTPDGRVFIVEQNRAGFKPPEPKRWEKK